MDTSRPIFQSSDTSTPLSTPLSTLLSTLPGPAPPAECVAPGSPDRSAAKPGAEGPFPNVEPEATDPVDWAGAWCAAVWGASLLGMDTTSCWCCAKRLVLLPLPPPPLLPLPDVAPAPAAPPAVPLAAAGSLPEAAATAEEWEATAEDVKAGAREGDPRAEGARPCPSRSARCRG